MTDTFAAEAATVAAHRPRFRERIGQSIAQRPDIIVWSIFCILALILLERLRAPRTFFFDEWNFIFQRRQGSVDDFLAPHNGHLSLLPVSFYKIALSLFGMNHYRPFRIAGLFVHLLVASLVYGYIRSRLGAVAGLATGVIVLLLGSGWQNILWPFQIGFMGSMAAGVGTWILIGAGTPRRDRWASIALGAGLASSGLGVAVVIGTAARLAVDRQWRRLILIVGPPTVLYLIWYMTYGESQGTTDNLPLLPRFAANEAASSMAGLAGRSLTWGRVLICITIAVAIVVVFRHRKISGAIAAPLVCVTANWLLIGYSRAQGGEYGASRYVYIGGVLILLTVADLLEPVGNRIIMCLAPPIAVLSVWGNWELLHSGARGLREVTATTRSELRAVEWAERLVNPMFQVDGGRMPQVSAGEYLDARRDLGSAAASDGEVELASEGTREETDRVSLGALDVTLAPGGELQAENVQTAVADGTRISAAPGDCLLLTPSANTTERKLELSFPSGSSYVISAADQPIDVRIRRYADLLPNVAPYTVAVGQTITLSIPADMAPRQTWIVDLRAEGDIKACNTTD